MSLQRFLKRFKLAHRAAEGMAYIHKMGVFTVMSPLFPFHLMSLDNVLTAAIVKLLIVCLGY